MIILLPIPALIITWYFTTLNIVCMKSLICNHVMIRHPLFFAKLNNLGFKTIDCMEPSEGMFKLSTEKKVYRNLFNVGLSKDPLSFDKGELIIQIQIIKPYFHVQYIFCYNKNNIVSNKRANNVVSSFLLNYAVFLLMYNITIKRPDPFQIPMMQLLYARGMVVLNHYAIPLKK